MCGIVGFLDPAVNSESTQVIQSMMDSIKHRGPDDQNHYVKPEHGLAFGHVRLSIIDISNGTQPMFSPDGRYVMIYNGEVYNYKELQIKHQLNCKTTSDTEVIFEGLKKVGAPFIEELNGMFCLAFFNKQTNETLIARDRIGIKPLYIFQNDDTIAFSSELKALKEIKNELGGFTINQDAINSFLHLGYIPKPLTIYNEVSKFPPGHIGIIKNNTISSSCYWDTHSKISKEILRDEVEAKNKLKSLLSSSIEYRLRCDVPFGTFLSGGVDSSLISAIAQDISEQKINTFTIGFDNPKFNETEFAQQVSDHIGSNHHEFLVSENDAKDLVEDIINYYDEPFGDSSSIPTMMVSKLARKHVKMTLSGDGGDELFHGYGFYNWANRLNKPAIKTGRKLIGVGLSLGDNKMKRASNMFNYPKHQLKSHIFSQEQYYFTQKEINDLMVKPSEYPSFMDKETDVDRKLSPKEKQSIFDLNYYLRDDLLTKVDIASMKYSLETRVPILDHRIIEFALNLDENLKIKDGNQKYLLKQILYDYVPEKIFDRPKRGFSIPLQKWLQEDLNYLITENLSKASIESAGIVKFEYVQQLLKRFNNGEDYLFTRIWAVIVLHFWFKVNN